MTILRTNKKIKRTSIIIVALILLALVGYGIVHYISKDRGMHKSSASLQTIEGEACELISLEDVKKIVSDTMTQAKKPKVTEIPQRTEQQAKQPMRDSTQEDNSLSTCTYHAAQQERQLPLVITVSMPKGEEKDKTIDRLKSKGEYRSVDSYGKKAYMGSTTIVNNISSSRAIISYDNSLVVIDIDSKQGDKLKQLMGLVQSKVKSGN